MLLAFVFLTPTQLFLLLQSLLNLASFPSDSAHNFTGLLSASGFPYREITAEKRSLACECLLLYEVITIPAMEDICKGLGSLHYKGTTLLDLLTIYPNFMGNSLPGP